jgi:hypothetical protein
LLGMSRAKGSGSRQGQNQTEKLLFHGKHSRKLN